RLDVVPNSGITDAEGNGGGVNGYVEAYNSGTSHMVDRDPPAVPSTVSLVSASDSGVPGDGITNENTPSLQGMAEASVSIHVKSNMDGILGTTTTNASGEWTFTPSFQLSEGTHSITVTALDAAGNESAASVPMNLTIDTHAPIGHSVSFDDLIYNSYQASSISFSFADAE